MTLSAGTTMRAVVHDRYGSFDQLELRTIDTPVPKDDQVRVRVHAAGLHAGDTLCVRGVPFLVRFMTGLFKPKRGIPGFDVAGTVESVGASVTRFAAGDAVFGACEGACAEYVCVPEDTLAHKPSALGFEEAAAVPTSALAALHALRDVAQVEAGQDVLINGASGGVGTFAVQIAKSFGATVTGVCSGKNAEMVRALGADEVIDYTQADFTAGGARFDLILDNVENRPLGAVRRALRPKGMLIVNSGTGASGLKLMLRIVKPLVVTPFVSHRLRRYLSVPKQQDLVDLAERIEAGTLAPILDTVYPLAETAEALSYIEAGHARGKVVVTA